jgi:SWIB/MDM2 domain
MVRIAKQPTTLVSDPDVSAALPVLKPSKKAKTIPPPVEVPPPVLEAVVEPVVDDIAVEVPLVVEDTVSSKISDFGSKLQQTVLLLNSLRTQYKSLEKAMNRELKFALKISNRKNKRSGNRKPSGFVRPTLISEELAEFLSVPSGSEMARTDVSKEINNYIRLNSLQDKTNGRQINPDDKLRVLLNVAPDEILTYFNLQKYMKHHFIKTTPTELLVSETGASLPVV